MSLGTRATCCFQSAFAVLGLAGQIWPDLGWKAEFAVLPYCFQSVFAVLGLAGQIWPDLAWKPDFAALP